MIQTEKQSAVILFGTLGCHLCDDALMLVKQALPDGVAIQQIDIADQPKLVESMGQRIPVAKIGQTELNWPFSLEDAQQLWQKQTSGRRYLR